MKIILKQVNLLQPEQKLDEKNDLLIEDGVIKKIGGISEAEFKESKVFEFENKIIQIERAINDIVIKQGNVPHMLEFEIYIDKKFVVNDRADGLIISTPTGSTAYALSGGGPILHPNLDAIVLLSMFSHTLSSRPLAVAGNSQIQVIISSSNLGDATIRCDGQDMQLISPGTVINLTKNTEQLRLIHPCDYDYFENLRTKLGWGTKPSSNQREAS